ncbi:PP2C family protein-serine/threonine phosphatase [Plantactinospora soyae]|uniref:Serine/threonine protein phosphatase PrpC n=1 Tax=Plantactinospora soyae TaxID=1544732 RepID=A0A927MCI6_9ACTN|nr:SpoIIE family protein phosphatase [Plantactinospora soyae]MBE1488575.1 serine/threonine protein phosphatase PrpC [Plantactinospora soyae]
MHRSPVTGPDRMPAEGDVTRSYTHAGRRLHVAGGSRVGNRYAANFDVLHVDPTLPFLAVADGMGDGRGSTVAGSTTMQTMVTAVHAAGHDIGPGQLREAMAEAQFRVRAAGAELGELTGCTFTGLVLAPTESGAPEGGPPAGATPERAPGTEAPSTGQRGWPRQTPPARTAPDAADRNGPAVPELAAWIVQIGDSRAYRLRDGLLELLTVDHTAAWLGAVYGWYPADSPAAAAARYQLTRYVGHPGDPEPDLLSVALRPGDVYCLCTDGVAEQLDYQRLANRLGATTSPAEVSRAVLADTLVAGGRDNATIAVLRVEN